ncbi:MAG: NAD(P)H-hydrate epimerase [Phycisphaerales bacterium]|nr:NAD(P)H-hydrate epimerase [Phycisphaerales bacterium]
MATPAHHRFNRGDARGRPQEPLRVLDRAAARKLDETAIQQLGMPGILLMEHAAQSVQLVAAQLLSQHGLRRAVVVCGPGNNGGDGYAVARLLANDGVETDLVAMAPPRAGTDAATNATIWTGMGGRTGGPGTLRDHLLRPCIAIDALFGTGLDRPLEGVAADLVNLLNDSDAPILAVDLPSGLDADTGNPLGPCIRAERTVTFVAPKPAMLVIDAAPFIGEFSVGDIGTPPQLLEALGREVSIPSNTGPTTPNPPPPPPSRRGP